MKKVSFTVGIIAVLVGVAFAGMAATASQPPPPWDTMMAQVNQINTNVTSLQGSVAAIDKNVSSIQGTVAGLDQNVKTIVQGNITMMQTLSGIKADWLSYWEPFVERSYDGIRHFHVSCAQYATEIPGVEIEGSIQKGDGSWEVVHHFSSSEVTFTDEFDASKITMRVLDRNPVYVTVVYAIAMTYYENQP
jgi:hypothetical protein